MGLCNEQTMGKGNTLLKIKKVKPLTEIIMSTGHATVETATFPTPSF